MKLFVFFLALAAVSALPSLENLVQSRIVGGLEAEPHSAPYIVSLQWAEERNRRHFCAGAILDKIWVVTAAHCISALPEDSEIVVKAGQHNIEETEEDVQVRDVDQHFIHEDFIGGISANDIAMIRLTEPLEWSETVQPIQFKKTKEVLDGEVKVYGWGSVSYDIIPEFPSKLQVATMPVIDYQVCEMILGGEGASPLEPTNICTGPLEGGISACNGDSGGPLVKENEDGEVTLVGVVSWGFYPCGNQVSPSIYTNVSAYSAWIKKIMMLR